MDEFIMTMDSDGEDLSSTKVARTHHNENDGGLQLNPEFSFDAYDSYVNLLDDHNELCDVVQQGSRPVCSHFRLAIFNSLPGR